jgi:hypothetical protein
LAVLGHPGPEPFLDQTEYPSVGDLVLEEIRDYPRATVILMCYHELRRISPCGRELARRYRDRPVAVLGVYEGTQESLRKEIDSGAIDWPCLWNGDQAGPIHQRWHIAVWPSLFILDQSGRIRFKGDRYRKPEALRRAVEALMREAEVGRREQRDMRPVPRDQFAQQLSGKRSPGKCSTRKTGESNKARKLNTLSILIHSSQSSITYSRTYRLLPKLLA